MNAKYCRESRVIKTNRVFQNDVNSHNTLFGGRIMRDMDKLLLFQRYDIAEQIV